METTSNNNMSTEDLTEHEQYILAYYRILPDEGKEKFIEKMRNEIEQEVKE